MFSTKTKPLKKSEQMSSSVPAPSVPRVAGRSSLKVDLGPAGGSKWWCTCGLSASQPWCDGSHKNAPGGFAPLEVKVTDEIRGKGFCSCKLTKNPPFWCVVGGMMIVVVADVAVGCGTMSRVVLSLEGCFFFVFFCVFFFFFVFI
jgi:hypothetical protein